MITITLLHSEKMLDDESIIISGYDSSVKHSGIDIKLTNTMKINYGTEKKPRIHRKWQKHK